MSQPLLEVSNLVRHYERPRKGLFGKKPVIEAVKGVSFRVERGQSFGIVGESGSGKSTLARAMLALEKPTSGKVLFKGENLFELSADRQRAARRHLQMVFQDPFGSLDPKHKVRTVICEPLELIKGIGAEDREERAAEALTDVGLSADDLDKYPHEFSGGQRQRIAIARALITRPDLIVADEPVSALDVSVQAQVLNLLMDLQARFNLTYIIISHDLTVMRHVTDRLAVMKSGKIVEQGDTNDIFAAPTHMYTQELMDSALGLGSDEPISRSAVDHDAVAAFAESDAAESDATDIDDLRHDVDERLNGIGETSHEEEDEDDDAMSAEASKAAAALRAADEVIAQAIALARSSDDAPAERSQISRDLEDQDQIGTEADTDFLEDVDVDADSSTADVLEAENGRLSEDIEPDEEPVSLEHAERLPEDEDLERLEAILDIKHHEEPRALAQGASAAEMDPFIEIETPEEPETPAEIEPLVDHEPIEEPEPAGVHAFADDDESFIEIEAAEETETPVEIEPLADDEPTEEPEPAGVHAFADDDESFIEIEASEETETPVEIEPLADDEPIEEPEPAGVHAFADDDDEAFIEIEASEETETPVEIEPLADDEPTEKPEPAEEHAFADDEQPFIEFEEPVEALPLEETGSDLAVGNALLSSTADVMPETSSTMLQGHNLIDGEWYDSSDDRLLRVVNPSDGEAFGYIARGTADDVDHAVNAARRALDGPWGRLPAFERGRILTSLSRLVLDNADHLAALEARDVGKPLGQARADAIALARYFEFYGGAADKIHGETIPYHDGYTVLTLREPHGVTAHIVPWNYPMQIIGRSVGAALAMGNAAVLKPGEDASLTALEIGRLALEAGLPPGVLNIVTGLGEEAGAALAAHRDVDHVSFTGSVEAGRQVQQAAASHSCPVTLELGGKSPQIVFTDADLDGALPFLVSAAVQNAGQTCSAGSRVLIQDQIYDELTYYLAEQFDQLTVGPADLDPDCGPVINLTQQQRIEAYLERAQADGLTLLAQGRIAADAPEGGCYVKPTLLGDVPIDHPVAQEEVFGPVLAAIRFSDEDEAISIANNSAYGLVAGIWTQNGARQMRLARAIKTGQVFINNYGAGGGVELPFGGVKSSGFGREKGFEALYGFSTLKTVAIRHD